MIDPTLTFSVDPEEVEDALLNLSADPTRVGVVADDDRGMGVVEVEDTPRLSDGCFGSDMLECLGVEECEGRANALEKVLLYAQNVQKCTTRKKRSLEPRVRLSLRLRLCRRTCMHGGMHHCIARYCMQLAG